jgi:hypothetical protein
MAKVSSPTLNALGIGILKSFYNQNLPAWALQFDSLLMLADQVAFCTLPG